MRVLFISQYFPPETGAPPNRAASFARGIRDAGHDLWVLAEKPSHPEGRIWPSFKGGFLTRRSWEGIPVTYLWVYATARKSLWARVCNHISFLCTALVAGLFLPGRFDVVLYTTPPLFAGIAGRVIGALRRSARVLDVRDLWPDVAVALGELRNPLWLRLSKRLERGLYNSADAITTVTDGLFGAIAGQVENPRAVHLIRNGSYPDFFGKRDPGVRARLRDSIALPPDHLLVAYVGNLGLAHGVTHLIEAASVLAADSDRVHLVFVGTGVQARGLQNRAAQLNLSNVSFIGRVDQDTAADWMAAADALVVTVAAADLMEHAVPAKLYDALAAGRPVILGAHGEAERILAASGSGIVYSPENAGGFVDAVRTLGNDFDRFRLRAEAGMAFVRSHCDRAMHARAMVNVLESVVKERAKRVAHHSSFL